MVLAAGGYDSSGNVRLFRCKTPTGPMYDADAAGTGAGAGANGSNGIVNSYAH
jgi:hypothetical protein